MLLGVRVTHEFFYTISNSQKCLFVYLKRSLGEKVGFCGWTLSRNIVNDLHFLWWSYWFFRLYSYLFIR